MTTYQQTVATLLADPATSYWLKDALRTVSERDILDALDDAEMLVTILQDEMLVTILQERAARTETTMLCSCLKDSSLKD